MPESYAGLSYEEVVRKYADTVASVCLMRIGNYADAEDCFQNTFLKLYTSSPEFHSESYLKAWLLRVAINECKGFLRSIRNVLPLEAADKVPVFLSDDSDSFPAVLMRLKPKYRETLYLFYCEEYRVDEIAEILRKNPNTVKTLLRRGREQIKELYGGEGIE